MIFIKKYLINNYTFNVEIIIRPKNKNIYLRLKDDIIYITAPNKLTDEYIKYIITKKYNSLIKLINKPKAINLDIIHYLGNEYKYKIIISDIDNVLIDDDTIYIYSKNNNDYYIKRIMNSFYINTLEKIVENNISFIKSRFDINFNILFKFKDVSSYYGQCVPKKRIVTLATKLAKYDEKYIISVIYHELAHFKYLGHNMNYYNYLEQIYKNYRKVQRELRQIKYNDRY